MPDKDFDNLFRDKFENAEIEPSANLWANIEQELAPKRKRIVPIYWMAAASVAIVVTAMLVFQKEEKVQPKDTIAQAKPAIKDATQTATPTEVVSSAPVKSATASTVEFAAVKPGTMKVRNAVKTAPAENNLKNISQLVQPKEELAHLPIKQQDVKPLDVVPVIKETAIVENPVVIASHPVEKVEDNTIDEVSTHKGIRNVGDLVNYVVDKVDKRDKKLIKFNTDDDDNSSIIGINIGFLKLNKKHKDK